MKTSTEIPARDAPVMDVELFGPAMIADPWPTLTRIRNAGPMVWNTRGHWMTAHDKVCRRILNKPVEFGTDGASAEMFGAEAFIAIDDKATHNALRNVWAAAFRRDSLETVIPAIRRFCKQLLDAVEPRVRAGERVDIMAEFCRPLPAYVIASMMGVPDEMLGSVVEWSDLMANAGGGFPPDYDSPSWRAGEKAKQDLADYLIEQIKYRRANPGEDLISQIVHSDVGKKLSEKAVMVNTRQLLFAGNETTAKWLGHIVLILGRMPEVRRGVMQNPVLLAPALDEIMRWEPVVHALPRRVHGNAMIAEVPLPDGAEVVLLVGGANRDPERYKDPDRLDIHRERKANMGFGYGLHSCLGVVLAQLEALDATSAFITRFPCYQVPAPVRYTSFGLRGPSPLYIDLE
jgi:cytochrome P450